MDLAKDADGNVIPVDFSKDGLVPGAMSNVKPFKCGASPWLLITCPRVISSQGVSVILCLDGTRH